jgi:hydroxymethylpyrimidine kinase/phosphomethylpyrimidine kinase
MSSVFFNLPAGLPIDNGPILGYLFFDAEIWGGGRMSKVLLTIAGFDPSAGAGVLLDLKVFARHGFRGVAALSGLTVQNTGTVKGVHPWPTNLLLRQYRALAEDIDLSGIKVGMAATESQLKAIAGILRENRDIPRVVDPVFRSSSGAWLLEPKAVPVFLRRIGKHATVLTPNLDEAGGLTGSVVRNVPEMIAAAKAIYEISRTPCLVTGGHLEGEAVNCLFDGRQISLFPKKKLEKDVHGTGCLFSSSLLCFLAMGRRLERAAELATEFTHEAIRTAVRIGRGRAIFR